MQQILHRTSVKSQSSKTYRHVLLLWSRYILFIFTKSSDHLCFEKYIFLDFHHRLCVQRTGPLCSFYKWGRWRLNKNGTSMQDNWSLFLCILLLESIKKSFKKIYKTSTFSDSSVMLGENGEHVLIDFGVQQSFRCCHIFPFTGKIMNFVFKGSRCILFK